VIPAVAKASQHRYTTLQITPLARPDGGSGMEKHGETQMNIRKVALSALFLMSLSAVAQAACVVHVNRTACPGKEAESYAKCGGSKECDKEESSGVSVKSCEQAAASNCPNTRLTITKSKVVTAKFNGKTLRGGSNFCASNRPDFNKCAK
jgi:hypothetical protein